MKAHIHLFERAEKSGEGVLEMRWTLAGLAEILRPELILAGNDRDPHRPVFMRALRPGKPRVAIDPEGESQVPSRSRIM